MGGFSHSLSRIAVGGLHLMGVQTQCRSALSSSHTSPESLHGILNFGAPMRSSIGSSSACLSSSGSSGTPRAAGCFHGREDFVVAHSPRPFSFYGGGARRASFPGHCVSCPEDACPKQFMVFLLDSQGARRRLAQKLKGSKESLSRIHPSPTWLGGRSFISGM